MGLFSTLAFGAMGGSGLVVTGLCYGLGLWWIGHRLWQKADTAHRAGC